MIENTHVFCFFVTVLVAIVLAIGSFMGYPNDPELSGIFWLLMTANLVLPLFYEN